MDSENYGKTKIISITPETVSFDKFDPSMFPFLRKGLDIMNGYAREEDDSTKMECEENIQTSSPFTSAELDTLRDVLGRDLIFGNYTTTQLKEILANDGVHKFSKKK